MTLSDPAAAQPTFVPEGHPAGTEFAFELTASDGSTVSVDTVRGTVDVNEAPVVTTSGFLTGGEGDMLGLAVAATDPDSPRSNPEPLPMEALYSEAEADEKNAEEESKSKSLGKVLAGLFLFLLGKGRRI